MRNIANRMIAIIWGICIIVDLNSCSDDCECNERIANERSTSLFVATDRHEAGEGNNLALILQMTVSRMDVVVPRTVLLGGDYVGKGADHGDIGQPAFSLDDLRREIFRTLSPWQTDVLFTYGSHDKGCTDGYQAFFSGPRRCDGYYVYGVSYAQMVYPTDSMTLAAVALNDEQQQNDARDDASIYDTDADNQDTLPPPPPRQDGGLRPYNGIDVSDPFGISAESAASSFTSWVSTLNDHAPIVVMSHVPIHAHRNDNPGGVRWFDALNRASQSHDIILLFGHNHSPEERGDNQDQYVYLLTPGDSIKVQGDSIEGVQQRQLNFTYANAGYLKLGWATLLTFTDKDGDNHLDQVQLRRFNCSGEDDSFFGLTGKPNPCTLNFRW